MDMPSISVIVPVYQAERYLKKCVESVLKQTFSDWELLLIDDGCTDASPVICDECAVADDRIRVFHKKKNGGVSAARNLGLNEAKGDYIAFRELSLGYNLPKQWVNKAGLGSVQLTLTAQNLGYLTEADHLFSPEQANNNGGYPLPRTFVMGVNVSF